VRCYRLILDRLIDHASAQGIAVLRLETGDRQLEALSLYRSAGFMQRRAFAGYPETGASIFMEKRLA
jgi:putative acetyltransferase